MSIQADNWAREEHATAIAERRGCYHCLGLACGIQAAKQDGRVVGFPPDLSGNFMILNGTRFRVINAWTETEAGDGRKRWGIVTEGEEQPAAPADATAPEPYRYTGPLTDPGGFLAAFKELTDQTANVNPPDNPITPEERTQGAQWIERPSGPPVRVDGPGCTPAVPATFLDEVEGAMGSSYRSPVRRFVEEQEEG